MPSFSFSRAITSFSQIVVDEHSAALSEEARGLLLRVRNGGMRLGELVDDLLAFSQLGRHALRLRVVDVHEVNRSLQRALGNAQLELYRHRLLVASLQEERRRYMALLKDQMKL